MHARRRRFGLQGASQHPSHIIAERSHAALPHLFFGGRYFIRREVKRDSAIGRVILPRIPHMDLPSFWFETNPLSVL